MRDADISAALKGHFFWFEPGEFDRQLLNETVAELQDVVSHSLGGVWQVVNFKIVESLAGAPDVGMYEWHVDHFPNNFYKLLIYLSGVTSESGCTEIKLPGGGIFSAHGPKGSWVLFNANKYWHRGRPVTSGRRLLLELTITRRLTRTRRISYGGINSCYPQFPWISVDL